MVHGGIMACLNAQNPDRGIETDTFIRADSPDVNSLNAQNPDRGIETYA